MDLSNNILVRLGKVRAHVALEVEVGKLIRSLELEEGGKLLVGVDLASILLVLEVVGPDILVNVAGNLSPSHLGTSGLLEELGELVTDERGLNEPRRSTVSSLPLALNILLLRSLELARPLLLEGAILGLESRDEGAKLLELSEELNRLIGKGRLGILGNGGGGRLGRNSDGLGGLGSLHLLLLCGSGRGGGGGNNNRGRGGRNSSGRLGSRLGHFIIHIYMITF